MSNEKNLTHWLEKGNSKTSLTDVRVIVGTAVLSSQGFVLFCCSALHRESLYLGSAFSSVFGRSEQHGDWPELNEVTVEQAPITESL